MEQHIIDQSLLGKYILENYYVLLDQDGGQNLINLMFKISVHSIYKKKIFQVLIIVEPNRFLSKHFRVRINVYQQSGFVFHFGPYRNQYIYIYMGQSLANFLPESTHRSESKIYPKKKKKM